MKRKNFVSLKNSDSESDAIEEGSESDVDSLINNGTDESCSENDEEPVEPPQKRPKGITIEQLQHLEETENLYHSNLFRMQIDELLKEVKRNRDKFVGGWLERFNALLKKIPEQSFEQIPTGPVSYPLQTKVQDVSKCTFEFLPPDAVTIIGSQSVGTNLGATTLNVDIAVRMPFSLSKKDDYLNERILHKKAYYLQVITKNVIKMPSLGVAMFNNFQNDPLRPVLQVEVPEENVKFIIHVLMHEESFKLSRLNPEKNNIRSYMALQEEEVVSPTPHYNANVLFDLTLGANQELIGDMLRGQNVRDAVILLKIWLKQRHFDEGFYGFNGYVVTMFVCYLLKTQKIQPEMSSYQIVRLFWQNLAMSRWDTEGITLCFFSVDINKPTLDDFQRYFDVVFLDSTGYLNVAGNLSKDLYDRVRQESQRAVQCLDDKRSDAFNVLFMRHFPVFTQYDHILTIKNFNVITKIVDESPLEDRLNFIDSWYPLLRKGIMTVLRRGLGQRVSSLTPINTPTASWKPSESQYVRAVFSIGLILNADKASVILDNGPQAIETTKSAEFREFWGDKCSLRRFPDASIVESCLWCPATAPIGEKRMICRTICLHLLRRHFKIPDICMHYLGDQFDVVIRTKGSKENDTGEGRTLTAIQVFDTVAKELRLISSIPLPINSVMGVSPAFRYCDMDVPKADAKTFKFGDKDGLTASKSLAAVFQLATSGKWPDDLEAFRSLKTEFYLQIAEALEKSNPDRKVQVFRDFFYILADGFVFKIEMAHPKEILLLSEYLAPNKITKLYKDTEQSLKLMKEYQMLPKLSSCLHGLHSQWASFGPAVNMVKRWLYSHLIDAYLWPEECTELIMAHLYMKQHEMTPAFQPQTSFLRFLTYLATTNFTTEMIVVDFNRSLDAHVLKKSDDLFTTNREAFSPLCIITSCDFGKQAVWSKKAPTADILRHVTTLAKSATQIVEEDLTILCPKRIKPIFTPTLTGFNLIIRLKDEIVVPSYTIPVEQFTKLKQEVKQKKLQAVDFNAVQCYLHELRESYHEFALFFYDPCEGTKIAVLWKPDAFTPKPFKQKYLTGRMMKGKKLVPNVEAILSSFTLMGTGIVEDIDILSEHNLL